MNPRHTLDSDTFEQQRREHGSPWVAVFIAKWCQPCDLLLSRLSGLSAATTRDLWTGVVDVDREPTLAERYGVRGMPTLLLFVDGEPRATRVGALSESQLEQFFAEVDRS